MLPFDLETFCTSPYAVYRHYLEGNWTFCPFISSPPGSLPQDVSPVFNMPAVFPSDLLNDVNEGSIEVTNNIINTPTIISSPYQLVTSTDRRCSGG